MRHCVPLSRDEYLIIDKEDGIVRTALYRRTRSTDPVAGVDRTLFNRLVKAGFLPKGDPAHWVRFAHKHADWRLAVEHVLSAAQSRSEPKTVLWYIGERAWSGEL